MQDSLKRIKRKILWGLKRKNRGPYTYKIPEETGDGWHTSDMSQENVDIKRICKAIDGIFNGTYDNIHSLLIVKNGKLILEEYFPGKNLGLGEKNPRDAEIVYYGRDSQHWLCSTTKSINSILVGIALHQHEKINVNQKLYTFFPEYDACFAGENKREISLKHALTMTTGFQEESPYFFGKMVESNDSIKFVLDRSLQDKPGTKFSYSNGIANVLGMVVKKITDSDPDKFAQKHLFAPLGITDFKWIKNSDGRINTCSGLHLRSRDLAKIGYLFLNNGKWQEKQIVPQQWIQESTQKHAAAARKGSRIYANSYGYQWWISPFYVNKRQIPSFSAQGHGGQFIFVFPSLNMVTVFTAGNYNYRKEDQSFAVLERYLIPAVLNNKARTIDLKNKDCLFPLIGAARNGKLDTVKYLIHQGVNLEVKTENGENALIYASLAGHSDVVKYLINQGADVNTMTKYGYTPLHWAFFNGHQDVMKYLMSQHADVESLNHVGNMSLIYAVRQGNLEKVDILVNKGVDIQSRDDNQNTLLIQALNDLEIVKYLVSKGVEIDAKNKFGHTALMLAFLKENWDVMRFLIDQGADIGYLLLAAVKKRDIQLVKLLLEKGADANYQDQLGYTASMWASALGNIEITTLLDGAGAASTKKTIPGENTEILLFAVQNGFIEQSTPGYQLKTLGLGGGITTAIKKTHKKYHKTVSFTLKIQTASKDSMRNGFLIFGNDSKPNRFLGCGINIDKKMLCVRDLHKTFARKYGNFDANKIFDLVVIVDIKTRKIKIVIDNKKTLKAKLLPGITFVTHVGYACINTETYFSKVSITGE